jgi:GrpB-like predicted nucleotidyltransferase (UPF0157 family)
MKLERHPSLDERYDPQIVIVDHDPAWAHSAQAEMRRIAGALGAVAVRIDHVGSTSVPGLAAKPIVDLQVSVPDVEDLEAYVGPLERLGYRFVPDPQSPDFHYFALPARRPRTHHVHVCQAGSDHERRHLALRDFLRAHPDEAAAYEAVKRDVAARHPRDRLAYIAGKDAYVVALEARALERVRLE